MQYQPANLLGGFYSDSSKPWSVQDTVNWIPEVASAPGTRTQAKLRTAPGLKPFVEIGPSPIRGSHNCEGKLFVVSGNKLYQISNAGIAIPIGTIPGTGLVQMSHNQRSGGNELIVVNGTAGYVYNTRSLVFERITDPGYPGAGAVDYIDQYLVQVEPFGRFWFHSDLADALNYNTLDRYESEASPDKIVTLITNNLEVVVFNETTTEFFDNTGAATNTFQNKRAVIDVGCAGRNAVAKIDRSLIWLGNDGVVYYLEGYSARPISNAPIEQAISSFNWANAIATVYESEGHKIFYLTFPGGLTFGYDVTTQMWHRRASFGMDRWRINTLTYWNRKWIAGDFQNGRLYELDWKYPLEGDQPLVRERTSGVQQNNQNLLTVPYLELILGVGQKEIEATEFPLQPIGPTITGDAPNGYTGQEYSFQYTTVAGDNPIAKVTATGLPEGWSMSTTGLLTGTSDVPITLKIKARVTDTVGLWDEVDDTIVIGAAWWLTGYDEPGEFNSLYISPTPKDMTGALVTIRNPAIALNVGSFGGGYYQFSNVLAGLSSAGLMERADHIRESDGVVITDVTTVGTMGASDAMTVVASGDVVVVTRRNGDNYFTSSDKGETFTPRDAIGGRMPSIGRLSNGRWVCAIQFEPGMGVFYTDEEVPINWTPATISGVAVDVPETTRIVVSGNRAMFLQGSAYVVTNGGAIWVSQTHGFGNFNSTCGEADGDAFVFGGANETALLRTLDGGANWSKVAFQSVTRISVYENLWVMTAPGEAGGIFWSEDNCGTMTASILPAGVTPSFYGQLFLSPVSNIPVEP